MGGDPPAPTANESTQEMLRAYTQAFPDILRITNEGVVPTAQTQLRAAQTTAPGMAALQQQLFEAFGPALARTGNQINREQAQAQATSDLDLMRGTGRDLVQEALATQRIADPEYYQAREQVGSNLSRLLSSIDTTGNLSPAEREEMTRGLSQQNERRGIANNPSQTAALENAVTFGGAARDRQMQGQNQLAQALSVANGTLPAMRSGTDVFQVATGRSSMPNSGVGQFQGVDSQIGQGAAATGNNLMGQIGQFQTNAMNINANRRDSLDRFNQSWGSIVGSL